MKKPSMRVSCKRIVAIFLILTVMVGSVFASPLKSGKGFGDAKVYDSSYKAIPSATEILDGFVIKTNTDSVVLDNGSTHIEMDPNSLAIFISLDKDLTIYILDGRMLVSSNSGDFTVMTTVTTYNAKSGSSIYVITDTSDEIAFVSEGSAQAQNFISRTITDIGEGNYIDNSISGFTPEPSTVASIWGEPKQKAEEPEAEQKVEQKAEEIVYNPLIKTFRYGNIEATITAYKGYAELTYPTFITDEELVTAASAAAAAYPQYMDGIYYQITGPGKVAFYYPESYGESEFNLAVNLINAELPAYLASLAASQTAVVASAEETKPEEQPQEVVQEPAPQEVQEPAEAEAEAEPQTQPGEKTPLETVPRPEQPQPEPEKKSDFHFGLWAGGVYGKGNDRDTFAKFPYTEGMLGTFWTNYSFFLRPYISFKGFTFGLNAEAYFVDNELQFDTYSFDTKHGATGYINSVVKYISVLGFESENFSIKFDLKSDFEFRSPIIKSANRLYATQENLLGQLNLKAGVFTFDAFIDDLKLTSRLEGKSQFAGLRAGLEFGNMKLGLGAVADFGKEELEQTLIYPSVDLSFPFTLADTRISVSAEGAAQIGFSEGFKLYGLFGRAIIGFGYGPMDISFGGAYNKDRHFSNLVTNAPVSTEEFTEGTSIDAIAKLALNTKVFSFNASFSLPINMDGGRFANTVRTRNGSLMLLSADVLDLQIDLRLGGFTFTVGTSVYGFAGKVSDLINADSTEDALENMMSPETATTFAKLDFKAPIGTGTLDVFVRVDLDRIEDQLRFPLSLGASYAF